MTINLYPLNSYMLTCQKCNSFTSQQENIEKKIPKKKIYISKKDDNLFWIFYYLLYGNIIKETVNEFNIKNEFKIQSIIKHQNDPSILKPYRVVRKNEGLQNLQENVTNVYGLHALCLLHDINIIYVVKHLYYEIMCANGPIHVIQDGNLIENVNKETLQEIKISHVLVTDFEKPLKGIANYKKDELIDMAKNLKLNIHTDRIIKKGIYDLIYDLIKIEKI